MSPRAVVPVLPFEPIAAEFPGFFDLELAAHCGTTRRNILRWRRHGISVRSADEVACRIGLHPLALWGQAWIDAEDECDRLNAQAAEDAARRRAEASKARRVRKREWARERAGWTFMEGRWAQWVAQCDRNAMETAERRSGDALHVIA